MKVIKNNYKIFIGLVLGFVLSGIGVYAASVVESSNISYKDNSGLGVDNVQAAIDQTCANIDSRLYNYQLINTCQNATTSTDIAYTGISYTIPANSIANITVIANFNNGYPMLVALSTSSTTFNMGNLYTINSVSSTTSGISATANIMTSSSALPLYVWAKYYNVSSNMFCLRGYVGTLKS